MSHTTEWDAIQFPPRPTWRQRASGAGRRLARGLLLTAACLGTTPPVWAQQAAPADEPRYSVAWHGGLAVAALLGSGLVLRLDRAQRPACAWCGVDASGQPRVPRLDAWAHALLRWNDDNRAAAISQGTVSAAYVWPIIGLAAVHGGIDRTFGRDMTAVLSSVAVTQVVTDVTKRITRRSRPHVVFDADRIDAPGDVHSFLSGHTASAFAAVVSTATIASRRHSGHARWIWLGGLSLAGATGYLRIAGNRHYMTDVMAGAALGSAIGVLMPRAFDGRGDEGLVRAASRLPIAGLGPVAAIGPGRTVRLQFGAGLTGIGLLGAVNLP